MGKQYLPKLRFRASLRFLAHKNSLRLFSASVTMVLLCLLANVDDVNAAETSVKVVQNGIFKGNLVMQFRAEGIFTEKVIKFLTRGFTIRVEYKIELWQSRRFWFDSLDNQHNISYQIEFEPLEKRYICFRSAENGDITSKLDQQLGKIVRWTTFPEPPLVIVPVEKLSSEAEYYYKIEIVIATLTAENIKDLQKWLNEFGEKEEEPSTLTRTSFRVAADFLSSRNHKKFSTRSEKFRLSDLPQLNG